MERNFVASYPDYVFIEINREENYKADELSKLGKNASDLRSSVYFEELLTPSIEREEVFCIASKPNLMTPFMEYLESGTLQEDKGKARYL